MRISTTIDYAGDLRGAVERAIALEDAGLDMLWVAEAYGFDAVSFLGYLAARTRRAAIGSAILPVYSRTPALLAQTAAGLDWVSGGRFVLGIGASGPQVVEGWHGVAYDRPVQRTREVIELCRRAWRREVLTHDGAYRLPLPPGEGTGLGKPLKMITRPLRERIPIYVAALGERNVAMTAEIADGWLPMLFAPERAGAAWEGALSRGRRARSNDLAPLEIVAGGAVAIGERLEALRDLARPMVALYVGGMGARGRNFYNDLVARYGYEEEASQIQELYLAGKRREAEAAVPAELLEQTSLIGSPSYVRERLDAYREAGVTVLNVVPVGPDPAATVGQLREWMG
ncbi:MAG: LLM class F420-dependent oxidoreductase [Acidimicrobiales bacterium]